MKCPNPNAWHLLSAAALDEAEAAELHTHAQECTACQAEYLAARREHAQLLRAFEVFDRGHDQLREQFMSAAASQAPVTAGTPAVPVERSGALRRSGGILMSLKHKPARWAVAALLPAACLIGALLIVLNPGQKLAYGAILERMRAARTLVCDLTMQATTQAKDGQVNEHVQTEKLSMYFDGTIRAWRGERADIKRTWLRTPDRLVEWQADGTCQVLKLSGTLGQQAAQKFAGAGQLLEALLAGAERPDRELGEQTVDGRRLLGFEISAAKGGLTPDDFDGWLPLNLGGTVRLWVDPLTRLPVRVESSGHWESVLGVTEGKTVWSNMVWDSPLDAALFIAPPQAEQAPVTDVHVDLPTEDAVIAALRSYAELADRIEELKKAAADLPDAPPVEGLLPKAEFGEAVQPGYPTRLDPAWLTSAWTMRCTAALILETLPQRLADRANLPPDADPQEYAVKQARKFAQTLVEKATQQAVQQAAPVALFYAQLQQSGRAPEYFGATVTPGDGKAVLLRWRLDEQHVRVVYGDLRVETVVAR